MHIACKKQKGKVGLTRVFNQVKIRCGFQCTLDRGSWVTLYMLARLVNKVTLDSQFLSPSSSNLSEVIIELTASDSPATERNPEFIVPLLTGRDHPGEPSKKVAL